MFNKRINFKDNSTKGFDGEIRLSSGVGTTVTLFHVRNKVVINTLQHSSRYPFTKTFNVTDIRLGDSFYHSNQSGSGTTTDWVIDKMTNIHLEPSYYMTYENDDKYNTITSIGNNFILELGFANN